MNQHEQYADDLALHALNALQGEDRVRLEAHLAACSSCRRELEQLRGDTALLALSAAGSRPPQRSRQRLLDAISKESPIPASVLTVSRRSWWGVLAWAATAAVLVFSLYLYKENAALKTSLSGAQSESARNARELDDLRRIAAPILAPEAQHVTLVSSKTPPQPQGKAFYLRNRNSLVFLANNMPPLPPQKVYELWLIPTAGNPIPAGTFKPDAHGSASVVNPPLPAGVQAKAFAITVENASGSNTPTMPIVMMGAGE
jgi:anti-sigma-K factor RskA